MRIYLHDIPLDEAQTRFHAALQEAGLWRGLGKETILLNENALGRVLAEPVWAKLSSPHYHASAMDGFAVRAGDTDGATLTAPLTLTCGEGAQYVDTGDPLPGWANAVIPIEHVEALDQSGTPTVDPRAPTVIRIRASVPPWKHVRPMGEDMVATELVLPAGHTLRPVDLGAIAGCGHSNVVVARKPRIAVLPTGSELKPIGEPVASGDIIEYNSLVLAAQINMWGGAATRFPITRDRYDDIRVQVTRAATAHDLVLLNAGSSAGAEDFSAQVIESLGTLFVHGVAVRPGHPVILGILEIDAAKTPIIGVPGYPVSAAMTGEIFVKPILDVWLGRATEPSQTMQATLTRKTVSPGGDDDYVRVAVGKVGDRTLAAPLARGAGVITSLVRADGIVVFPRGSQGALAGEQVTVRLNRNPAEVEKTIFAIGSHDMSLDLLAQHLSQADRRLASANVGSLGGLIALRRGEAHFAGSHLLDPATGTYNLPYIDQYLPDTPVVVMRWVRREQGLIVQPGNPLGLRSLADLTRPKVRFVNRQRGAGTRVLLDYELDKAGIPTGMIGGYLTEEYTHLAVAASVASGRANVGLGIPAAAHALDLDFIPLFHEEYHLVIPKTYFDSSLLAPLFTTLDAGDFQRDLVRLPGYDVRGMGEIVSQREPRSPHGDTNYVT